jgi:hypothetical protein
VALERARTAVGRIFNQRCFYLFVAVLALVTTVLFIDVTPRARVVINTLHILIDVAAVAAVGRSGWSFFLALALAAPAAFFHTRSIFGGAPDDLLNAWLFGATLYIVTLAYLMRYVFQRDVMTADRLYGAAAGYLMLGGLWTFLFAITNQLVPGSFLFLGNPTSPTFPDLLYFSFTTLSTTGSGDFVPALRQARALVVLEQVAGSLFIAILIARLTGVYPPPRPQPGGGRREPTVE